MLGVILAAGMGRRLGENIPKAFIPIDGKPIIEYSLENLRKAGIKNVFIVIGFMEDFFKKKLGNNYNGLNITYVTNKEFSETSSMYSLSQTEGLVNDDIILLESDLIYEYKALDELLKSNFSDFILTSAARGTGDEVWICFDKLNNLTYLDKKIENKHEAKGELVGINKLTLPFLKKLYEKAKKDYERDEKNCSYEETIFKLSKEIPVKCLHLGDLVWTEIDTKEDLRFAKEKIFPKIKDELL